MKKVFIFLGAVCIFAGVFCACLGVPVREGKESQDPLSSLKADALYTEPPDEEVTSDTVFSDSSSETAEITVVSDETTAEAPLPEETVKTQPETSAVTTAPPETTVPDTEKPAETVPSTTAPVSTTARESAAEVMPESAEPVTVADTSTEQPAPAKEQLLDFSVLQKVNPDICAWIEIDGTVIDDPILQSPTDDAKYLSYGYDDKESTAGAIYTEATYNSRDFNDPVTLIYGHKTIKGHMFGALYPTYSDPEGFAEHSDIKIYLPGEVRHYTVFAAVPYDGIHIMYTYDFSNTYWYRNFFKSVKRVRAIGANINEDAFPMPGDRVIILSVCIDENNPLRFLVMAVLEDDLADNVPG